MANCAVAVQLPATGGIYRNSTSHSKSSLHVLSERRFLSGRPLYSTVDFFAAVGYRLGWIAPCMVLIPRRSMQSMQVLKAELEESDNEKAGFKEAKMGKEELEESNIRNVEEKELEMVKARKEELEEPITIKDVLEESNIIEEELEERKVKNANLFASKNERMFLPMNKNSAGTRQPISSFFSRPSGTKSILNVSALQDFQYLCPNTYRCTLPKMEFLKFEVAPVLDLRVISTCEECLVEMLSCRIEGSELLESQNKRFSASAKNHITWNTECEEPFVDINVELNVILEVNTLPFSLLPVSAVERPGNILLQALLNRLVPNFLEQMLEDYRHWVQTGKFESESEMLFHTKIDSGLDES